MKYKEIIRTIKDIAGKTRVFVDVGDEEAIMLKFDEDPKVQQIKDEIQKLVEAKSKEKANELERVKQQIKDLTDRKNQLEEELK